MAILGAHMLLYTAEPDALRAMLRDAFGFKSVDAGGGWLIFALPPAELGIHPAEGPKYDSGARHQITFMCDDLGKTMAQLRAKGVEFVGEPEREDWGIHAIMNLPGGTSVMLYQPLHPLAISLRTPQKPRRAAPASKRARKAPGTRRRK
jgi:catechol 2,3-dioxygenase-like lactoylglutathione lyase family enzyme